VTGQFPLKCDQMVKFTDANAFVPVAATVCSNTGT
jgi:hypothetical protein